ncbi:MULTISPECIES: RNA polymerase sigma factor [Mucilaginibacter]|uniref:RNA polymerase sigma-70 factor n=3 Tax=Mucilaginibacter TaxID=423349 RepID=A0A5B8US57_9SPHI|nr:MULTISPECIES: RNA polymerase sigma-70 factor [Mucilaginibacter]MBE9668140.1 RNA polymerase sigma-70 factor [Mucilaginibacter boryungensis]QEC61927.1 RNA polymerase sigma-70 factor [Mucilaginibacter ginsenosidivorans]
MVDPNSFEIIFRKFYPSLCFFAERITGSHDDAEDVIEELFVKLWNKQLQFETEQHLKAYLYRSAKNACLDFLKVSERSDMRNTFFAEERGYSEDAYLNEIIRAEIISEVYHAIESLSPQCSKIITMSYLDGKSNQEIADELNLSVQTVKNQKGRGLAMLKQRLPNDKFQLLLLIPYLQLFDLLYKH